MFRINKTVVVPIHPYKQTAIDLKILTLVEEHLQFRPLSHVDKKELPPLRPNTRRFFISNAYSNRDKV